eukprot:7249282-Ditylum_brightwellii.AAC.1
MAIVKHFILKTKDAKYSGLGRAWKRKANVKTSVNMDNTKKLEAKELIMRSPKRQKKRDSDVT